MFKRAYNNVLRLILCAIVASCSVKEGVPPAQQPYHASTQADSRQASGYAAPGSAQYTEVRRPCTDYSPERRALFGDLHVHTALSFDAVAGRIDTRPADAHRFARGEAIPFFPQDEAGNPSSTLSIDRPLDFLAVTDHSDFLGERALCTVTDSPAYDGDFCRRYREVEFRGTLTFATMLSQENPKRISALCGEDGQLCLEWARGPWQEIIAAAEAAYDRSENCEFTSFIGYEYTGTPRDSNYHRNVIFRNDKAPQLPVSWAEAPRDFLLWQELDSRCEAAGCDYMTIPHNSNLSNGKLLAPYANLELSARNRTQYARQRLARETLMEVFQHKGSSECVNGLASVLGAADELCELEQVRRLGDTTTTRGISLDNGQLVMTPGETIVTTECAEGEQGIRGMFSGGCVSRNDFLRTALLTGMEEEADIGLNPVKLGVIVSTDGHTATPGNVLESDWNGTVSGEMSIEGRLKPGTLPSGVRGNPGGLAGVWAVENSRDAIFEAMLRRETFGTSGPRISPRFFAGWGYADDSCDRVDLVELGYAGGVPMGGDLAQPPVAGATPRFILAANRDSSESAAPLQKLQLIKGWLDADGQRHTRVMTVAGSSNSDASVNVATGERFGKGYDRLCAVYQDRDFDPARSSYYYLRVVENPSPRWSMLDCLRLAEPDRPDICADSSRHITQEMAWSSPIWYTPPKKID
jgi:Protein of unknown function (DUF3604)